MPTPRVGMEYMVEWDRPRAAKPTAPPRLNSNPARVAVLSCTFFLRLYINLCWIHNTCETRHGMLTAVGFEPTPLRTGALNQRLRPLGQTVFASGHHKTSTVATCPRTFPPAGRFRDGLPGQPTQLSPERPGVESQWRSVSIALDQLDIA